MIDVIKNILKKLIDNVDKYKIEGHFFKYNDSTHEYHFGWKISSTNHAWILVTAGNIKLGCSYGFSVNDIKLDDDNKYEILDLCQKLKKSCEEYTREQFIAFLDSDDTESNNID